MNRSWVLYGAYGHAGSMIVERARSFGLQPLLAGDDPERLSEVAARFSLDWMRCSLDDPAALDALLRDATVVLNCAGPFSTTAEKIVGSCLRSGTHYLDIAGEPQVFSRLAGRDEEAKRAGVMLLPGVGLDIVPSDYLAHYLKKRLPTATKLVLGFRGVHRASRGAINTLVDTMLDAWPVPHGDGTERPAKGPWTARIDFGDGAERAVSVPWADVVSAHYSTGIKEVFVYLSLPFGGRAALRGIRSVRLVARRRPLRRLLSWGLSRRGIAAAVPETREHCVVYGEASNAQGRAVRALFRAPDGYGVLTESALAAVRNVLEGRWVTGFQTPTRVYGCGLVDALSDVEFEDIDTEEEL